MEECESLLCCEDDKVRWDFVVSQEFYWQTNSSKMKVSIFWLICNKRLQIHILLGFTVEQSQKSGAKNGRHKFDTLLKSQYVFTNFFHFFPWGKKRLEVNRTATRFPLVRICVTIRFLKFNVCQNSFCFNISWHNSTQKEPKKKKTELQSSLTEKYQGSSPRDHRCSIEL